MSMRTDWQAAKAEAKKANNNIEVKFPVSADLGPLFDKYEAAKKVYEKAKSGEQNAAWAKSAETYFAAVDAAGKAAKTYLLALPRLPITDKARQLLASRLAYGKVDELVKANKEAERLKPLIAKAKARK